jgi:hypothetical protein
MSFHVRVTFSDGKKQVIALGETVIVGDKPVVLTASIPRKYTEISYSLEVRPENSNL